MKRGSATTLSDIAKDVGVTAMTVSVVLNGTHSGTRVSDSTRQRIKEAAERLRYRPNIMARGLVRRRVDTIGIVSPVGGANLYFHEVLDGVLLAARENRQNTTILSIGDWDQDAERIIDFGDGRIDSIVLVAPLLEPSIVARLTSHIPVATIHPNYEYLGAVNVFSDEETGAYEATKYLISLGHKDIAHFSGPEDWSGGSQRKHGFLRAMNEAGLKVPEHRIHSTRFTLAEGRDRMQEMLSSCTIDQLPTAIFCGSDGVAFGAMQVLAAAGIDVPGRVSIIGFDDNLLAQLSMPSMTTVRQPFHAMARRAIDSLVTEVAANALQKREAMPTEQTRGFRPQTQTEILPVQLIVRDSVRRLA